MSVTENRPVEDKRKKWLVAAVCLAAVAVSASSIIRQLPSPPKSAAAVAGSPGRGGGYPGGGTPGGWQMPSGTRGQITTITASAISIKSRDGVAKSFAITPATKITVDQKPVTATDLKPGQRARVVSADNKTATEVHIRTRPFGGRGGYPGGGGGYPVGPPGRAPAMSGPTGAAGG